MRLPSTLEIGGLVRAFLPERRMADMVLKGLETHDPTLAGLLDGMAESLLDVCDSRVESNGPQELNRYGWLKVAFGNYYDNIVSSFGTIGNQTQRTMAEKARKASYLDAQLNFTSPNSRGHEDNGHKLVISHPELLQIGEIASYYNGGGRAKAASLGFDIPK